MAYDKVKIPNQVNEIGLEHGCIVLKDKFKNEKQTAFWINEFTNV